MDAAGNPLEERHQAHPVTVRPEELLGFGQAIFAPDPSKQVGAAVDPFPRVTRAGDAESAIEPAHRIGQGRRGRPNDQ